MTQTSDIVNVLRRHVHTKTKDMSAIATHIVELLCNMPTEPAQFLVEMSCAHAKGCRSLAIMRHMEYMGLQTQGYPSSLSRKIRAQQLWIVLKKLFLYQRFDELVVEPKIARAISLAICSQAQLYNNLLSPWTRKLLSLTSNELKILQRIKMEQISRFHKVVHNNNLPPKLVYGWRLRDRLIAFKSAVAYLETSERRQLLREMKQPKLISFSQSSSPFSTYVRVIIWMTRGSKASALKAVRNQQLPITAEVNRFFDNISQDLVLARAAIALY